MIIYKFHLTIKNIQNKHMKNKILASLRSYDQQRLKCDLLAGLTVAIIVIPQGMAYSLLAGLNPIYGLYTALISMTIYPMFASSREMSVGPVALMSIVVLSSISAFAEPGSTEYLNLVLLVTLISGLLQVIYSVLNAGMLTKFLSFPVMSGFISAAGVIIAISQIKYLLSLDIPRCSTVPEMIVTVFSNLSATNFYSLIIGLSGLLIIMGLKKISNKIPNAIIAVILGSLVLYLFNLQKYGVPIVGELPQGLPTLYFEFINLEHFFELIPAAFVISIICFIGSFSIAKSIAEEKSYNILPNKELLGLGMAKIVGSFFLSFPSTGSFTRSAINEQAGAKTKMSSLFGAIFLGLTLLFLSSWFYYLPEPILAAIVISSVFSLINYTHALKLMRTDRKDFVVLVSTFFLTLILGIQNGVIAGIIISFVMLIRNASKSHYIVMGDVEGKGDYRDIRRFKNAETRPDTLIYRYDNNLFFANSEHFYQSIIDELDKSPNYKFLVLNMSSITNIDSTGILYLRKLHKELSKKKVDIKTVNIKGKVRDIFDKNNLFELYPLESNFVNISSAVDSIPK